MALTSSTIVFAVLIVFLSITAMVNDKNYYEIKVTTTTTLLTYILIKKLLPIQEQMA